MKNWVDTLIDDTKEAELELRYTRSSCVIDSDRMLLVRR